MKAWYSGINSSAAGLSADSFSPCSESCQMLWRWQNLHNHPDEAMNTSTASSFRASLNPLCNSRVLACSIAPVMGTPSSHFCLNQRCSTVSSSSSFPSFIVLAGHFTPLSVILRLYCRSDDSRFLMSVMVERPIPYFSPSMLYEVFPIWSSNSSFWSKVSVLWAISSFLQLTMPTTPNLLRLTRVATPE